MWHLVVRISTVSRMKDTLDSDEAVQNYPKGDMRDRFVPRQPRILCFPERRANIKNHFPPPAASRYLDCDSITSAAASPWACVASQSVRVIKFDYWDAGR